MNLLNKFLFMNMLVFFLKNIFSKNDFFREIVKYWIEVYCKTYLDRYDLHYFNSFIVDLLI